MCDVLWVNCRLMCLCCMHYMMFYHESETHVYGPKAETTGTERELVSSPAPKLSDHKSGTLSQGPTGT